MDVENILRLADAIERHAIPDLGFNMRNWFGYDQYKDQSGNHCGTTACIAGWAVSVLMPNRARVRAYTSEDASAVLGLTDHQAMNLFMGNPEDVALADVTTDQAVRTLRYLAATGEVDWDLPEA